MYMFHASNIYMYQSLNSHRNSCKKVEVNFLTPLGKPCLCNDRFPIPDLRNGSEVTKLPWWQKNLRDELLILDLQEARFQTSFLSNQPIQQVEVSSRNVLGRPGKERNTKFLSIVTMRENSSKVEIK